MRLALYQPDIPQNTGAILRLAACCGVAVDIIGPCGFVFSDRRLKRAGMDYLNRVDLIHHTSWRTYQASRDENNNPGRLVLLTTHADTRYEAFRFVSDDTLMLGRESAGVPTSVHNAADSRIRIPVAPGNRSLNVAMAAAMVLGEALRQTALFPDET